MPLASQCERLRCGRTKMLPIPPASNSENTYAVIALVPKTSSGVNHRDRFTAFVSPSVRPSNIQIDTASNNRLHPTANNTNELVHSFLLIGNEKFHSNPSTRQLTPAKPIPRTF